MPGPKSAISEKFQTFNNSLNIIEVSSRSKQLVDNLKTYLKTLSDTVNAFYIRDPQTNRYPAFTEQKRDDLVTAYKKAAVELSTLMRINSNNPVLKEISVSLSQDISIISQADIGPNTTLPRVIDYGQTQEIDISGVSLGKAGGKLSSRIPMTIINENGEEVPGFFTPETKFDPMALFESAIDRRFPQGSPQYDQMQQFKQLFRSYAIKKAKEEMEANGLEFSLNSPDIDPANYDYYTFLQETIKNGTPKGGVYVQTFYTFANKLLKEAGFEELPPIDNIKPGYTADDAKKWNKFEIAIASLCADDFQKININQSIYQTELQLHIGDNIDKRNAAMSTVAGLLKVPNLIVKSKSMTVIKDGVKTQGTFLPSAEGKDLTRLDVNDKSLKDGFDVNYNFSSGYKDIADLQILDYICGNIDRHFGNMLYKFDANGKFSGIQGIDNDASFGSNIMDINKGENQIPPFETFGFISESMAQKVLDLTPEYLKIALAAHGLAESELNAASVRLRDLQSNIKLAKKHYEDKSIRLNQKNDPKFKYENNFDAGYPQIIPDDVFASIDFENHTLFQAMKKTTPSEPKFSRLLAPLKFCHEVERLHNNPNAEKKVEILDLPKVRQFKFSDAIGMDNQKDIYSAKLKELKSHDKWYIKSSPEFRNMRTALRDLSNLTNKYAGKELSQEGYTRMKEQLENLETYNNDYITMKTQETDRSKYAEERLTFANEFRNFIAEKKTELEQKIKSEVDIREDRRTDSSLLLNEIIEELKASPMTPQLAGKAIKTANEASKLSPIHSKESTDCLNLVRNAMKYLKAEPKRLEQSNLSKNDLKNAMKTVEKGLLAGGKTKEKVAEAPELQSIQSLLH